MEMSTRDLLDHFKRDAKVTPEYTLQASHRFSRSRGVREKVETKWKRKEIIGEGAFGQVWRELSCHDHSVRAVKSIEKQRMRGMGIDIKRELLALAKFSKEEYQQAEVFVSFYGWFENEHAVFLAMEYVEYGDLGQYILSISREVEVIQISTHLLYGLRIMHAEGFAHRDLKPQNIFVVQKPPLAKKWWVKIGDFGISKRVKNDETALRTHAGTRLFAAPEVQGLLDGHEDETYNNSVDMWSLGCVIYNLSARRLPFLSINEIGKFCRNSQFSQIAQPLRSRMSKSGVDFITHLLVPQPAQRISVENALKNPWIVNASPANLHDTAFFTSDLTQLQHIHNTPGRLGPVTGTARDTLKGHTSGVTSVAFSPDGRLLASGSIDDTITLWDPVTGAARYTLKGHTHTVMSVAFSPNGRLLASGSVDNTVRLWDPVTGAGRATLKGHTATVSCVAFSPDGQLLASGSADATVRLWDPVTGAAGAILQDYFYIRWFNWLKDYMRWVNSVAFSPDGRLLASGSNGDNTVKLWDPVTGSVRATPEGHTMGINSVAFSPDGRLLASGSTDDTITLWDPVTGAVRATLKGHTATVSCVAFSPDGQLLASGSHDATVRLWDPVTGTARATLKGHTSWVDSVAFSPNGRLLASASDDETVRLWDLI